MVSFSNQWFRHPLTELVVASAGMLNTVPLIKPGPLHACIFITQAMPCARQIWAAGQLRETTGKAREGSKQGSLCRTCHPCKHKEGLEGSSWKPKSTQRLDGQKFVATCPLSTKYVGFGEILTSNHRIFHSWGGPYRNKGGNYRYLLIYYSWHDPLTAWTYFETSST